MSGVAKLLGPRYVQMAKNWMSTGGFFGGATAGAFLYMTDWKVIVAYIPYYGGKFKSEN